MDAVTKSIITKLAWDTFAFYHEKAIDIALHVYIQNELRALNKLENASDKQIEEYTDIIEATIIDTPEEIKNIEDNKEQKEAFEKYFKENQQVKKIINNVSGDVYGNVNVESGTTVTQTFNFGDVHKVPKS